MEYSLSNYEIDKIEKIYLSGDGASWIKQGLEVSLGKTLFVLDQFHTNKAIKNKYYNCFIKKIVYN